MGLRSLGAVLLAIICAAVLGVASMLVSASAFGVQKVMAGVALLADVGWIMTGSGVPTPSPGYISGVERLYLPTSPLFPGQATFSGYTFQGLSTPEEFCPALCFPGPPDHPEWTNLNFGDSMNLGVQILNNAIMPQLQAGDNVAVLGDSQSDTITTQEMDNLIASGGVPDPSNLHVVMIGDPNNPIGGILERFQLPDGIQAFSLTPAPQHLPFFNVPLGMGPTPITPFPTDIYTGEYDGWANLPQDPTNILGDINAILGILTVHVDYLDLTPKQLGDAVINLGTIGDTNIYYIPENLPILAWLFDGGPTGQFYGDLFSPFLRLIIDWGYGNAGDPAVDGFTTIPLGAGGDGAPDGSPYEAVQGVAGGPWAETPLGTLWDGSSDPATATASEVANAGLAGFFMKMDPLQMLAGIQNAGIQSIVGPFTDYLADMNGGTLSLGDITVMNDVTAFLQIITGYDLVNLIDQGLLTAWNDLANAVGLGSVIGPDAVLDGPLIPGQPIVDLIGGIFDIFNFFGA